MNQALIVGLLCLSTQAVQAQGVWRCGHDGRSYADTPCKDDRALELTSAARPAGDVAEARAQARQDAALVDRLVRERQMREALLSPQVAAGIRGSRLAQEPRASGPLRPKAPGSRPVPPSHRLEGADTWRAIEPSSRRTKG